MSPWSIPQEMQMPAGRKNAPSGKANLLFSVFLPFALAVLGIPVYLMVILKIIGMMQ